MGRTHSGLARAGCKCALRVRMTHRCAANHIASICRSLSPPVALTLLYQGGTCRTITTALRASPILPLQLYVLRALGHSARACCKIDMQIRSSPYHGTKCARGERSRCPRVRASTALAHLPTRERERAPPKIAREIARQIVNEIVREIVNEIVREIVNEIARVVW